MAKGEFTEKIPSNTGGRSEIDESAKGGNNPSQVQRGGISDRYTSEKNFQKNLLFGQIGKREHEEQIRERDSPRDSHKHTAAEAKEKASSNRSIEAPMYWYLPSPCPLLSASWLRPEGTEKG